MGRREQPVKPGPLREFAVGLRELRAATGSTYRALAVKAGYSHSALAAAAGGESLPSLEVTLAYVGACGGDQAIWEQRWRELAAQLRKTHPGLLPDADHDEAAAHPSNEDIPGKDDQSVPPAASLTPRLVAGVTALAATDPRLVGSIRMAARLGAGSMGQVFLGRTDAGQPVAVKVVRADLAGEAVFRRRFRRELQALHQITGPHLAPLVDGDAEADQPWLATAYRPAVSLADAVDTHGPLPAAVVRSLAAGVLDALVTVHEGGLVHRDLKPSNVLLTADGVQVIDFGIAAAAEGTALTATGTHLGSAAYMAPEQALGGPVGPAADVFALGSLLGYALTGTPPFGEGRVDAVVYRLVHEHPDLTAIDAATSQDNNLGALVRACLDKNPDTRPSPVELRDAYGLGEALPGAGWLPEPVNGSITEHEAAAQAALERLDIQPPNPNEFDTAATATAALPLAAAGAPPAAVPRHGRRSAARIGLAAAALAVIATGLVVWRTVDVPAQHTAAPPGSGPAATSTSTAAPGASTPGSSAAASASTSPTSTVPPALAATHTDQPQGTAPGGAGGPVPNNVPATFSATIGEGCPNKAPQQVRDSGSSAWPQHTGADGCGGSYYATASVKNDNTYYWTFATAPVTTGRCDVQVYVPTAGNLTTSANYRVYTDPNAATYVTSFTVDQRDHQGQWVDAGTAVPTSGGSVQIQLTAHGSSSGTMAAGAITLTCHP